MTVLLDLEWIESRKELVPTQLAALRVDQDWNTVSYYSSLFHVNTNRYKKNHIAYSGYAHEDFELSPAMEYVLSDFCDWLRPEDEIYVWHSDILVKLQRIYKDAGIHLPSNSKHQLRNRVLSKIPRKLILTGTSPIEICSAYHLHPAVPEHRAENDVANLQTLLKYIDTSGTLLQENLDQYKSQNTHLPFLLDVHTNTVHKRTCAHFNPNREIKGYATLKTCVQRGYTLCPDCILPTKESLPILIPKDPFHAQIQRMQCNYLYKTTSRIFHRCNSSCLSTTEGLRGFKDYSMAAHFGLRPCKICNPTEDFSFFKSNAKAKKKAPTKEEAPGTRTDKADVNKALHNHAVASAEREQYLQQNGSDRLTQEQRAITITSNAFWASPGYSSFHLKGCCKLSGLTNLQGFPTYAKAVAAHFKPCRICKPTPKKDVKLSVPMYSSDCGEEELEAIFSLCDELGISHTTGMRHKRPHIFLETEVGKWCFDMEGPYHLMHINLVMTPRSTAYHDQRKLFLSMRDLVKYVYSHDKDLRDSSKNNHFLQQKQPQEVSAAAV